MRAKLYIDLRAEPGRISNKARPAISRGIQKLNQEIGWHVSRSAQDPQIQGTGRGPRRELSPEDKARLEEMKSSVQR